MLEPAVYNTDGIWVAMKGDKLQMAETNNESTEKTETKKGTEAEEKSAKETQTKGDSTEKSLEKMTVKELREVAKDIPGIIGVSGMKKPELYSAILEARGIEEKPEKKKKKKPIGSDRSPKQIIKELKSQRQAALQAKDRKMATIYKRRISRLKKKSRKAA
jgi:hypothetical protein